jgi:hypothetical protein
LPELEREQLTRAVIRSRKRYLILKSVKLERAKTVKNEAIQKGKRHAELDSASLNVGF